MEGSFTTTMRETAERLASFRQARLAEHRRSVEELLEAGSSRRGKVRDAARRCRRLLAEDHKALGRIHSENQRRAEEEAEQRRIFAGDLRAGTQSLLDMVRLGIHRRQGDLRAMADDIHRGLDLARSLRTGSRRVSASPAQPHRGAAQATGHAKSRSGGKARK
jgi:hypothetical protein